MEKNTETSSWPKFGCGDALGIKPRHPVGPDLAVACCGQKYVSDILLARNSAARLLETKLKVLNPGEQDVLLFNMCLKRYLEHHRHLEHHKLRSKEEISGAFCRPQMYCIGALETQHS